MTAKNARKVTTVAAATALRMRPTRRRRAASRSAASLRASTGGRGRAARGGLGGASVADMVRGVGALPGARPFGTRAGIELLRMLHRVDRGHREVLADEDLELGAVGLAQVRLVGRAVVDVGLRALERGARDLVLRRRGDLRGDVVGQRLLLLPVGAEVAARRSAAALPRRRRRR